MRVWRASKSIALRLNLGSTVIWFVLEILLILLILALSMSAEWSESCFNPQAKYQRTDLLV